RRDWSDLDRRDDPAAVADLVDPGFRNDRRCGPGDDAIERGAGRVSVRAVAADEDGGGGVYAGTSAGGEIGVHVHGGHAPGVADERGENRGRVAAAGPNLQDAVPGLD